MKRRGSPRGEAAERARKLRQDGYSDGYSGRPAQSVLAVYQQAYRRGVQAALEQGDAA